MKLQIHRKQNQRYTGDDQTSVTEPTQWDSSDLDIKSQKITSKDENQFVCEADLNDNQVKNLNLEKRIGAGT